MSDKENICCGPATDPSSKDCTLPSSSNLSLAGTPPNVLRQDRAIEARYGKPTPSPESTRAVPGTNFAGPGYAG